MTPLEKLRKKRSDEKKIQSFRRLQEYMISNSHLREPEVVEGAIDNADKYWSTFTDAERDYIRLARYALSNQTTWKI